MRTGFSPSSRASVEDVLLLVLDEIRARLGVLAAANPSRSVQTRPPTRSRASTTVTAAPRASSARAADSPASPAPATMTRDPARSRLDILQDYTWSLCRGCCSRSSSLQASGAGSEGARPEAHRFERRGSRRRVAHARRQGRAADRSRQDLPRREHDEGAGDDRALPPGRSRQAEARRPAPDQERVPQHRRRQRLPVERRRRLGRRGLQGRRQDDDAARALRGDDHRQQQLRGEPADRAAGRGEHPQDRHDSLARTAWSCCAASRIRRRSTRG